MGSVSHGQGHCQHQRRTTEPGEGAPVIGSYPGMQGDKGEQTGKPLLQLHSVHLSRRLQPCDDSPRGAAGRVCETAYLLNPAV